MGYDFRMPSIKGTDREQLAQIRSYLYQFIPQLQLALNALDTSVAPNYVAPQQKTVSEPQKSTSAEVAFKDLKPLIGTTIPLPRGQLASSYDPNNLDMGVHIVANNIALKTGDTVIMYNGVLIQMAGDVGGNVKIQLAFPTDTNRNPMFRLCWYSNWTDWRSFKL